MDEEKALETVMSEAEISDSISKKEEKRVVFHPFKWRLGEGAAIETSSSTCMTQVGFACLSIGMLTIFRPCFVLLVSILPRLNITTSNAELKKYAMPACYLWFMLLMFVFFVLGFIPMLATMIKKRRILLIHPWAMLVLYLDFIIWLTITVLLQIEVFSTSPSGEHTIKQVKNTPVIFGLIYVDILVYIIIYYVYGTYYIVAELTIIEKFY